MKCVFFSPAQPLPGSHFWFAAEILPFSPLLSSKSKETFVWVGNTISGKQKYFQLSEEFAGRKVPINLHYSEISLIIKRWEDDKGGIGL